MISPEFSRPERVDAFGAVPRTVAVSADAAERQALARRFDLVAVERLDADFQLRDTAAGIEAEGRVRALVVQACTVTGAPLTATIDEVVRLRFVSVGRAVEEIELAPDALDTIEYEGGAVDLGEAAAETMALALDPYPRAEHANDTLRAAGVLPEEEAETGAFTGLAALRRRLTEDG